MNIKTQEIYEVQKPPGKEATETYLVDYLLNLADTALILGHRNSEWCGHGPVLELDIAITNIALDLVGQARNFYQYAAEVINNTGGDMNDRIPATEDTLAYLRDAKDFKNCLLVEQPNGNWGVTIMRQFLFSTYQYYLYLQLQHSNDERIAAIAAKALKEVTYHIRWCSEWVIRLGAGTPESHERMLNAAYTLSQYTNELFMPATYEIVAAREGYGADITAIQPLWLQRIKEVFEKAILEETLPFNQAEISSPGKVGRHSGHLENILSEMQLLQRTHPGAEW